MPSVFLSYSRNDLSLIEQLERQLKSSPEISVWRDQEKIYGGQKWPKVLGEEIANQDVFLLVWSKSSAHSHFVEFEWTTAIALKKTIVPCLLDTTPLPPSLTAYHAHRVDNVAGMLRTLQASPPADAARRVPVIQTLDEITATGEKEVLEQVNAVFTQQRWIVTGDVFQAGRDFHYHAAPQTQPKIAKDKSLVGKWKPWVGLAVGVLTAVTLALGILDKLPWPSSSDAAGKAFDQPLAGQVIDASTGDPLPGVRIAILDFTIQPQTTNEDGYFRFDRVRGAKQERIKLTAGKDCYKVETIDATLGNTDLRPALDRSNLDRCK